MKIIRPFEYAFEQYVNNGHVGSHNFHLEKWQKVKAPVLPTFQ